MQESRWLIAHSLSGKDIEMGHDKQLHWIQTECMTPLNTVICNSRKPVRKHRKDSPVVHGTKKISLYRIREGPPRTKRKWRALLKPDMLSPTNTPNDLRPIISIVMDKPLEVDSETLVHRCYNFCTEKLRWQGNLPSPTVSNFENCVQTHEGLQPGETTMILL